MILTWNEPVAFITAVGNDAHEWRTACGRYRVIRCQGVDPRFAAFAKTDNPNFREVEIANDLGSLRQALDAAERYAKEDLNATTIESNRDAIEAKADAADLDRRPARPATPAEIERRAAFFGRKKQEKNAEPVLAIAGHDGKSVSAAADVGRTEQLTPPNGSKNMSTATKTKKTGTKGKTKADRKPKANKTKPDATGANVGKLSAINAAHQVLLAKKGEPMTCPEMIAEMEGQGLWKSPGGKTPAATLYSAILREIGKGADSRFVKADRGKFAAKV